MLVHVHMHTHVKVDRIRAEVLRMLEEASSTGRGCDQAGTVISMLATGCH